MKLYVLEVEFDFNGRHDALYPVVIAYNRELVLVDCGYPGFLPLLEKAAALQGLSLGDLTGVIVTHHDVDHMGGLFELREKYPAVKVYASAAEANYINGKYKSLRLIQAEQLYPSLPENRKQAALQFRQLLQSVQPVAVDHTFLTGETPDWLDGMRIISTPGHTPGHISIYLEALQILVAADALVVENGELDIANPHFTLDLQAAVASIRELQALAIDKLVCYHGGIVAHDIPARIEKLLAKYRPA